VDINHFYNRKIEHLKNFNPIPSYFFYDLNLKTDYFISKKDKLFLNSYYGRDVFKFKRGFFTINFDWGNIANTLKWVRNWNSFISSSTSVVYAKYDYRIKNNFGGFGFSLGSDVDDLGFKHDWEIDLQTGMKFNLGVYFYRHTFGVGQLNASSVADSLSISSGLFLNSFEQGAYLESLHQWNKKWLISTGLRFSSTKTNNSFYGMPEPRVTTSYFINESQTLKFSYSVMSQYIHLAGNSGSTLPTDIWYPSTAKIKPGRSEQWSLGYNKKSFLHQSFGLNYELFYKKLINQVDFKDGALLIANSNLENEFVQGRGWAYGMEVYVDKKKEKTTGWIGYTLSWSWRQFSEINGGNRFHPKNDRRHDISVFILHQVNSRVSLSLTWVFGNGPVVTMPTGKLVYQGIKGTRYGIAPIFENRNNYRLIDYHRMDLGLIWKFKPKWGESDLTFSIYNLYDRRNAYFIYFEPTYSSVDEALITGFRAVQVSLFPILPAFTYNFRF